MKRLFAVAIALLFFKLPPAPAAPPIFAEPGPYPVGVKTIVLVDSSREDPYAGGPRTLVTEVWYPAADEARGKSTTRFLEFFGAHPEAGVAFVSHFKGNMEEVEKRFVSVAVRNAPLRGGKFPLLVSAPKRLPARPFGQPRLRDRFPGPHWKRRGHGPSGQGAPLRSKRTPPVVRGQAQGRELHP